MMKVEGQIGSQIGCCWLIPVLSGSDFVAEYKGQCLEASFTQRCGQHSSCLVHGQVRSFVKCANMAKSVYIQFIISRTVSYHSN